MFIQEKDLYAEIKASSLAGSYFLFGEEDYLKKHRIGEIRTALFSADETAEAFNAFSFFYGEKEFDPESLESVLMSPPMMTDKKLVRSPRADNVHWGGARKRMVEYTIIHIE